MNYERLSITDYMTDGVLAQMCQFIGASGGLVGSLRDADGARIEPRNGEPPWLVREDALQPRCAAILESGGVTEPDPAEGLFVEPIVVRSRVVGGIALDWDGLVQPDALRQTALAVALIAATVSEFCEQEETLRDRNDELEMLFRLSGMLVSAKNIDSVLRVALQFALQLCSGDAGVVHLLDEKQSELVLRAYEGVSDSFVEQMSRLPVARISDREALEGGVRCVGDLLEEGRALHLEEIEREGIVGMVSSGLVFNGQPLGIVRIYSHSRAELDPLVRATLQTVLEQAATAVASQHLRATERAHRQVQRQLKLASEVQRRMLPNEVPDVHGVDVGVRYESSFDLGGDFYDFIELQGHLGLLVGDVVGKGVAAAMLMSSVRSTFRAHALDRYHLDEVMRLANAALVRDTLPNEFATVFYGVIDPEAKRLTFCSAGHEPPLSAVTTGSAIAVRRVEGSGLVIGVDKSHAYQRHIHHLVPGEVVLAYTDGVIDAMNFDGERFGRERLERAVCDVLRFDESATAQRVVDHVFWEVRRFVGLNAPSDDITLVAIRLDSQK